MIKCICEQEKAFFASPEMYDFPNKLLKNDEENASGEVHGLLDRFISLSIPNLSSYLPTRVEICKGVPGHMYFKVL